MANASRETPAARFIRRLQASLKDGTFVRLRLHPEDRPAEEVRWIELKDGPALSTVIHEPRRDVTRNLPMAAGMARLAADLARPGSAWLGTTGKSWQLVTPSRGRARLVAQPPVAEAADRAHDVARARRIEGAQDWMRALELTDAQGRPRPGRADKLRQIERYADVLAHLVADGGWKRGESLAVADMGCGKGYLTFAAWHLLRRALGFQAHVLGVDAQAHVVQSCLAAARAIGAEDLTFRTGTILDVPLPELDVLIALHACNDATDHALVRAVNLETRLVVVAPCCHKDLRPLLGSPPPLAPLLAHGLFQEHFAIWLTDGLRALALEAAGYRVKVVEFVAPEHTPRNTLIAGLRGNDPARREAAAAQYAALKAWAGLGALVTDDVL